MSEIGLACAGSNGSFENEALENEDRSTKHQNLENEAPKSRKRSTYRKQVKQIDKLKKLSKSNALFYSFYRNFYFFGSDSLTH